MHLRFVGSDNPNTEVLEPIYRPPTPVLTRRAVWETPKPGMFKTVRRLKSLCPTGLSSLAGVNLSCVPEEHIPEPSLTSREQDQLLCVIKFLISYSRLHNFSGVRPTLGKDTQQAIARLLEQTFIIQPSSKGSDDPHRRLPSLVLDFLQPDPPHTFDFGPRLMSPPLFPRHMSRPTIAGPQKLSDIRIAGIVNAVALEDEGSEDMSKLNMQLVDGWSA